MEETISLNEIFSVLKKRIWLIISITLLALIISFLATMYIITPRYEASSQFMVTQKETFRDLNYNVNDIRTNVELINTYNVIIKSPRILDQVIEELNLDLSVGQLAGKLNVSNAQGSQVVNVMVTDVDPFLAEDIANTTVEVFQNTIPLLMNVDNVSVLSAADVGANPSPISPNLTLNLAISIVLGLMSGVGLAFVLEYFDQSIKSEEDIERELGLPVMGVIPTITDGNIKSIDSSKQFSRKRGGQRGA
ncbi:capsular biosynthesis protein [Filobacillus milosensis]|uniref:Capsular biosynthesis protein n=1 Tax=Filobacillus milosensis TaxID=94137 RepID=A0A4Y8IG83_9BACI|nr:Wzz/FepE/Etk N-terminal domain-containing protein [Filobacillus milosensis]TFB14167.1 capsular biosynthesis protein [Filobacillus milosensis]